MKKLIFILNACFICCLADTEWNGKWFPYKTEPVLNFPNKSDTEWSGNWFPYKPGTVPNGPPMGVSDSSCDDGKKGIELDYDGNPAYYTCYDNRLLYLPDSNVHPILEHEAIPKEYSAMHYCMNESIYYNNEFPTFGPHRPLWGKYGEYSYIPKQRYIHNLEHGAVVLLYHPCADPNEVNMLKRVVRGCLFRHVISADPDLYPKRPLALLTWGNHLSMSKFDLQIVLKYIRTYADHAPENTARDGQYDFQLIEGAHKVSNDNDTILCENF